MGRAPGSKPLWDLNVLGVLSGLGPQMHRVAVFMKRVVHRTKVHLAKLQLHCLHTESEQAKTVPRRLSKRTRRMTKRWFPPAYCQGRLSQTYTKLKKLPDGKVLQNPATSPIGKRGTEKEKSQLRQLWVLMLQVVIVTMVTPMECLLLSHNNWHRR